MKASMEAEKNAKDEELKVQTVIHSDKRRVYSAADTAAKPNIGFLSQTSVTSSVPIGTPVISGIEDLGNLVYQPSLIITKYTVKRGDTLSLIAKFFFGFTTQLYCKLIQESNKDSIKDVNQIYPGQVLKIPVLPEELKKK